jgi:hypothetical protein
MSKFHSYDNPRRRNHLPRVMLAATETTRVRRVGAKEARQIRS